MYRQINRDLYGITSLIFILTAILLADIYLFENKVVWGFIYSLFILISNFFIIYVFCRKCPCKRECRHIIPGRLAQAFKVKPDGPYSIFEKISIGILLLILAGLPQIWIWKSTDIFFAFWILIIIGLTQIRTVVCKGCKNSFCPINTGF